MNIIREPRVYLVGRQTLDAAALDRFLRDVGATWSTDSEVGAERLCEVAGRLCYMSFGKGRKNSAEYLANIIESAHGSVLEHAVWNFIIAGVSRSFTHELVRHRAGFAFSQLSQRYVDESAADFVEPDCIAENAELHALWLEAIRQSHAAYKRLADGLLHTFAREPDPTQRRKLARQAARTGDEPRCQVSPTGSPSSPATESVRRSSGPPSGSSPRPASRSTGRRACLSRMILPSWL